MMRILLRIGIYGSLFGFVAYVLLVMFGAFGAVTSQFADASGAEARKRLGHDWPSNVDPAQVESVSRKHASEFDRHSTWYRIRLAPAAADAWRDACHAREEHIYDGVRDAGSSGIEGVHRTITGPPPLRRQTGSTPHWWSPPAIEFRATELMKWYDAESGVGRATYSAYDSATKTLWIYEYSAQHDLLWPRGNMPAGEHFSTIVK